MNILPIDNINICLLGCVSAGKSTILNTIICEDITQSKIKRTTMMPIALVETKNELLALNYDDINTQIQTLNDKIIKDTENGIKLNLSQYNNEIIFNIDKLDLKISKKHNITIFDMPGLNDARTKEEYYKYLDNNFTKFNIVIFVIDINSGLNTSDEMDILDFICKKIKHNNENGCKKTKFIVIANKIDDMNLNQETNKLEFANDEFEEMYNQIEKTILEKSNVFNINDNFVKLLPLCGLDSYLFRMINAKGINYKMTKSQIIRIGVSEYGSKFKLKKIDEQKKLIKEFIADKKFVDNMIKLSGFEILNTTLLDCLNTNSDEFVLENIIFEIDKIQEFDLDDFDNSYLKAFQLVYKLKNFDIDNYEKYFKQYSKLMIDEFIEYVGLNCSDFFEFNEAYEDLILFNIHKKINDESCLYDCFIQDLDTNYPIEFSNVLNSLIEHTILNSNNIFDIINVLLKELNDKNYFNTKNKHYNSIEYFLPMIFDKLFSENTLNKERSNELYKLHKLFSIYIKDDKIKELYLRQMAMLVIINKSDVDIINTLIYFDMKGEKIIKNWINLVLSDKINTFNYTNAFRYLEIDSFVLSDIEQIYIDIYKKNN